MKSLKSAYIRNHLLCSMNKVRNQFKKTYGNWKILNFRRSLKNLWGIGHKLIEYNRHIFQVLGLY